MASARCAVAEAFLPAVIAFAIFGIPAAIVQHRYSPIEKDPPRGIRIEWTRVLIVAMILVAAVLANVVANLRFPYLLDAIPVIGLAVWIVILATAPLRRPDWEIMPETLKGTIFLLALVTCASLMPVEELPAASWQTVLGLGLSLRCIRQHPAHRARPEARRLRLGIPRLRGRIRRVDDLVRLIRRRRDLQHVSRGEVRRPLASARLVHPDRLRHRLLRNARCSGWPGPSSQ